MKEKGHKGEGLGLHGLLPKYPSALWKEFLTILEFASLQTQNSPFRLRHWVRDRFTSLRMVTKNSLMFPPGISATTPSFLTHDLLV